MIVVIITDEVDVILTRLPLPYFFFSLLLFPFYFNFSSPLLHQAAPHLSTARLCPVWAPGASGRLASLRKKQLRTATYDSPANMCSYETIGIWLGYAESCHISNNNNDNDDGNSIYTLSL